MKIDEIKNKDLEIEWDVTIPSKTVNNELEKNIQRSARI